VVRYNNGMRKIIVSEMLTVDGFFAGPKGEIDWHVVDAEFNEYAIDMLNAADTILFGRVTYEMMASYWPTARVTTDDPVVAERMNSLTKIVFSTTQEDLVWQNSTVMKNINAEEILKMKQEPGKDILILGSGTVVSAFARLGLIDEYRMIVNPVALGKGRTLFADVDNKIKLALLKTKTFGSGNVLLYYKPAL
jgi:dihydrofolate reductase